MDPKSCQKSTEACDGGVSKRVLKKGPSPGTGKVRSGCHLQHFSKVGGLKKDTFSGIILGGPCWSKKSVVCRSKTSLIFGPLKIVILTPSGHPKSIKCEVIFYANLIYFEDDGDKQCLEIDALFSEELMLVPQFCCSVVGRYQQVQTHL